MKAIAWDPVQPVHTYPIFFINGYIFHINSYAQGRKTCNSGVCIKGTSYNENQSDFYGILEEIIIIEYPGLPLKRVALFNCKWFDPLRGVNVDKHYNMVEINHTKKYRKYESFVMAEQAGQVYFTSYPRKNNSKANWLAVCKVKERGSIDGPPQTYQKEVTCGPP
ncbi:hypothetical protein Dimus_039639 [Dionaea muscipula]